MEGLKVLGTENRIGISGNLFLLYAWLLLDFNLIFKRKILQKIEVLLLKGSVLSRNYAFFFFFCLSGLLKLANTIGFLGFQRCRGCLLRKCGKGVEFLVLRFLGFWFAKLNEIWSGVGCNV